ncbi:MAG: nitroreductase family protein [Nanoarchaeota archaeon]
MVAESDFLCLLEAARWAPSSRNDQPWFFLYAVRGSRHWPVFFDLLMDGNKVWCAKASTLMVLVSRETFEKDGSPSRTHSLDAGAAWQSLALQASSMGLVCHGIGGFLVDRAKESLRIPDGFVPEMMIAVGLPGDVDDLPEDLRVREVPSGRRRVSEFAWAGAWR